MTIARKAFGRFGASIEPNEDREGVQCFVHYLNRTSSLAVVEDFGRVCPDEPGEHRIDDRTISEIRSWAESFGY